MQAKEEKFDGCEANNFKIRKNNGLTWNNRSPPLVFAQQSLSKNADCHVHRVVHTVDTRTEKNIWRAQWTGSNDDDEAYICEVGRFLPGTLLFVVVEKIPDKTVRHMFWSVRLQLFSIQPTSNSSYMTY